MNRSILFAAVASIVVVGVVLAFAISTALTIGLTALIHWYIPITPDLPGRVFSVAFVCTLLAEGYFLHRHASRSKGTT